MPDGTTVSEDVQIRGYIPEGEEPTPAEQAAFKFGRGPGQHDPSFVPGPETKSFPLGSAEAQVSEAMAVSKESNRQEQATDSIIPYVEKMDSFDNVAQAVEFLDGQSQYRRDRYLEAEKLSKNRKTLIAHYR